MDPNNKGSQSGDAPNTPPQANQAHQQSAAANVIRSQISALYGDRPVADRPTTNTHASAHTDASASAQANTSTSANTNPSTDTSNANPYNRSHGEPIQPQAEQWKAYHSAWQNYYQQYYQSFYEQQQSQRKQFEEEISKKYRGQGDESQNVKGNRFAQQLLGQNTDLAQTSEDISKDQALHELRQKLVGKVHHEAKKIRKSRHFTPIAASLGVVFIFLFLQYNQVLFGAFTAYASPGAINPQNIVIDPNTNAAVSAEPRLIIPKINVDVPVLYDVGADHDSQMEAMRNGVAHFSIPGANSHPGEIGNTVLSGHSSNDLFDQGDYKFIFAQLEKLVVGDTIYANYEGVRYAYVITKKEVVQPTEVNKLIYDTSVPVMTLITCTPLGTSLERLLVTAEQISPDPSKAVATDSGSDAGSSTESSIPGASAPTLIEKLFGFN